MPSDKTSEPEHHRVPGAEILFEDTWGEEAGRCPNCGESLPANSTQCRACGQLMGDCARSCASCASPRCVGGLRPKR